VVKAADVSRSIFILNGDAVAARVRSLPWVESVKVTTALPASVRIAVTEWTPMARVLRGGAEYALAAQGASLRLTPSQAESLGSVPLLLDFRPTSLQTAVSAQLVSVLGSAASRFPSVFGVHVVAYEWDQTGTFSLWTSAGWEAVFGDIRTGGGGGRHSGAAVPGEQRAARHVCPLIDRVRVKRLHSLGRASVMPGSWFERSSRPAHTPAGSAHSGSPRRRLPLEASQPTLHPCSPAGG